LRKYCNAAALWSDVAKQVPTTTNAIVPLTKIWSVNIEGDIEKYNADMAQKLKDFKVRAFWNDDITVAEAMKAMDDASKFLATESAELQKQTGLVRTFDFPHLIKSSTDCVDEMNQDLAEMKKLWQAMSNLNQFIADSNSILWSEMNTDELDDGSKNQVIP